jgi:hypothetical protein
MCERCAWPAPTPFAQSGVTSLHVLTHEPASQRRLAPGRACVVYLHPQPRRELLFAVFAASLFAPAGKRHEQNDHFASCAEIICGG